MWSSFGGKSRCSLQKSLRVPLSRRLCAFNGTKSTENRFDSTFPPIRGWLKTDTEIFSFSLTCFENRYLSQPACQPATHSSMQRLQDDSDLATKKKRFFLLFKMHPESSRNQAPKRSGMRWTHCQQQMQKCVTNITVLDCIFKTMIVTFHFECNFMQIQINQSSWNMQIASRRDAKDLVPVAQLICNSDTASNLNVKATRKQLEEGMVKGCVQNCAKQLPSQGFFALLKAKKGIGSSFARSCAINSKERTFKGSTGLVFQEFQAEFGLRLGKKSRTGWIFGAWSWFVACSWDD